jgi:hypothetical protein
MTFDSMKSYIVGMSAFIIFTVAGRV